MFWFVPDLAASFCLHAFLRDMAALMVDDRLDGRLDGGHLDDGVIQQRQFPAIFGLILCSPCLVKVKIMICSAIFSFFLMTGSVKKGIAAIISQPCKQIYVKKSSFYLKFSFLCMEKLSFSSLCIENGKFVFYAWKMNNMMRKNLDFSTYN